MYYTTPPVPPVQPPKKDNKFQIFAASFFALAVVILIIALVMPSSDSGSSVATTDTTDAPAPIITAAPVNKYDQYYEHVLNNSGQANTMSKSDVIELGDLVCQALDQGNSIASVVQVVSNSSSDSSDVELGASAIYGAVTYLCPEYDSMMQAYLNN